MKRLVPIMAALLLAGCGRQPPPAEPRVDFAWVRLPAVPGRPAAAYFLIRGSAEAAELRAITSPEVERIDLHDTGMAHGMTTMSMIHSVAIPAGGEVAFAPGGRHAMLNGISPRVGRATGLTLNFRFSNSTQRVAALVIEAGDPAPAFARD
jgi:periplasmic copper chaperone A